MKTPSVRELSAELAAKAKSELNESAKRIPEDLEALRSWVLKQEHITARTDDQFLIAFLRGCKYSLERAKEKLDTYYTVRSAIPEFFQKRDPTDAKLQEVMTLGLTVPLPTVDTKTGSRIMLIKQGAYDPSKITITDVIKVSYMISDTLLWEDDASIIAGQIVIIDLKGLGFGHIGQCTPSILKKMTSSIQEAYPIRQKGIHFINPSGGFETIYKMFCNFMSSKIRKRIFMHESLESLHKHIDRTLLPAEYGGDAGTTQTLAAELNARLVGRRDWFLEDERFKTVESKRPGGKPKNAEALFGTVGSFRTLEFD